MVTPLSRDGGGRGGFGLRVLPRGDWGLALYLPREDPTVENTAQSADPSGGGPRVLSRDICQMGSLAGAAYLLHDNAGVLRQAQWEQNSHVEHKRKGLLD